MFILLVCNKFPFPPRDGGSLASYNMARGLVGAGNRLDILAMNTSKHYFSHGHSDIGITGLNKIKEVFLDNSVSYRGLLNNLLFSSLPYTAERFIHKEFNMILKKMLRENEYDIVQLEGLYLAPYMQTIRYNSDAKIIYRSHNIEHIIWKSYFERINNIFIKCYIGNLYKRIKNFEQEFINSYDMLVPVTKIDLEEINYMGNKKPAIIAPFGMYPDEIPCFNNYSGKELCLQYIGALDWLPNLEGLDWFITRVWVKLRRKYPGLRFLVAGRNAGKGYVSYLLNKGIDYWGEVEDAGNFFSENGILIVPLFSGSGIRVRIIEAMFRVKPVISSSYAASGIPVKNGRHLLMADDEHGFAKTVDKLLADHEYAIKLGMNARKLSHEKFDNRVIAEDLTAFYKNSIL